MVRTFIVYVADHPGVLNRVSSLFRRRGYNIESLTVGHTQVPEVSRMTVAVTIDERGAPLVRANLYKLADVLNVEDITDLPAFHREMILLKVAAPREAKPEITDVLERFHARALETSSESLVIEATGSEGQIDSLVEVLRPYGILEMTRTGRVAMKRGSAPVLKRSTAQERSLHVAIS